MAIIPNIVERFIKWSGSMDIGEAGKVFLLGSFVLGIGVAFLTKNVSGGVTTFGGLFVLYGVCRIIKQEG